MRRSLEEGAALVKSRKCNSIALHSQFKIQNSRQKSPYMRNCRVRKKYVNSTYFGTDFYAPFTGKHDPCTGYTLGTGLVWVWYVLFPYQVRTFRTLLKYPLNCGKSIGTLGQHLYSKGVPNTNPQEHQKFAP